MSKLDESWESIRELADSDIPGGVIVTEQDMAVCLVGLSDQLARLAGSMEKWITEITETLDRQQKARGVIQQKVKLRIDGVWQVVDKLKHYQKCCGIHRVVDALENQGKLGQQEGPRGLLKLAERIETLESRSHTHSGLSRAGSCVSTEGWEESDKAGNDLHDMEKPKPKPEPEPEAMTIPKMVAEVYGAGFAFVDLEIGQQDHLKQRVDFPHILGDRPGRTCQLEDWVEVERLEVGGTYACRYKDMLITHRFVRWLARGGC